MSSTNKNELILKNIAAVIADNPRLTMSEIAERVNISKTTLYRTYGTQEQINLLLRKRINKDLLILTNTINQIKYDYKNGLSDLILLHLSLNDFLCILPMIQNYNDKSYWIPYTNALDSFFLNGQKAGDFNIEFSIEFLTNTFVSIVFGTMKAQKHGKLSKSHKLDPIMNLFSYGIFTTN